MFVLCACDKRHSFCVRAINAMRSVCDKRRSFCVRAINDVFCVRAINDVFCVREINDVRSVCDKRRSFCVQETGANIKVYSQCCPQSTERVVQLCGKPETITNCIASIYELLQSVGIPSSTDILGQHVYFVCIHVIMI